MSTQPGDSQKSLLVGELGCSESLLDSASDLLIVTGAAEPILDRKRSDFLASSFGSLVAAGIDVYDVEGSPCLPPSLSMESNDLLSSILNDATTESIRPIDPCKDMEPDVAFFHIPSSSWCTEISKRSVDVTLLASDSSTAYVPLATGASTSGASGRSRELRSVPQSRESNLEEALGPEVSTGSDIPLTSPSQRTTAAGRHSTLRSNLNRLMSESSIQTSTQSEVDGHGFIILEGSFDRLPPFVHYDPPSDRTATRRNAKWRAMLDDAEDNWEEICQSDSNTLKRRVRKGIPKDWRYRAWPLLSGGRMLQHNNPNTYARLVRSHCEFEDRIMVDLHRTLPRHIYFAENNGAGQRALFNCLKAYAMYDPEVGYVQGMGSFLAPLLLTMSEEDAFWTFAALMREEPIGRRPETAGPAPGCRRLFLDGLPLTHELISKLKHLANEKLPHLVEVLTAHDLSFSYLTTKWWMTLFCFVLPFQHVLRVWDVFFLEGWKMALRTGLVILKCMESRLTRPAEEDLLEILEAPNIARSLPPPDVFIKMALNTRISKGLQTWGPNEAD